MTQNKRRRVEKEAIEITLLSSVMSSAPNYRNLPLFENEQYHQYVDQITYDARFHPVWANWNAPDYVGWRRYFDRNFWTELAKTFNGWVQDAGLPTIPWQELFNFMEHRRRFVYYKCRKADNFQSVLARAYKPCQSCQHVPFFPLCILNDSWGSTSYGTFNSGSGRSGHHPPQPDDFTLRVKSLYDRNLINEVVFIRSDGLSPGYKTVLTTYADAELSNILRAQVQA